MLKYSNIDTEYYILKISIRLMNYLFNITLFIKIDNVLLAVKPK